MSKQLKNRKKGDLQRWLKTVDGGTLSRVYRGCKQTNTWEEDIKVPRWVRGMFLVGFEVDGG